MKAGRKGEAGVVIYDFPVTDPGQRHGDDLCIFGSEGYCK